MKKLCCLLITALLLCALCTAAMAVSPVNDEANLYTEAEKSQMETLIQTIRDRYKMDVVVLTTYAVPRGDDSVTVRYADKWYEDNGCGLGEDRAGVLLIVDMTNRFNYMSTAGVMIDYMNDSRVEGVLSAADDYLSRGRYGLALIAELQQLQRYIAQGIEEGSFRYDDVTGERLSGLYNKLTRGELMVALLCGAGAALLLWLTVMGRYKLAGGTYHYKLGENASVNFTVDDAVFERRSVTRTRMPDPGRGGGSGGGGHGGSGSGVHVSSGGMSHGGGGHHF